MSCCVLGALSVFTYLSFFPHQHKFPQMLFYVCVYIYNLYTYVYIYNFPIDSVLPFPCVGLHMFVIYHLGMI